jgi:hypothetical protein
MNMPSNLGSGGLAPKDVSGLTLTYGDRVDLLEQMVAGLCREGVGHLMVLANGLKAEPLARLHALARDTTVRGLSMTILESPENLGSAAGFGRLLSAARSVGTVKAVWFMDDDNLPCPGALAALLAVQAMHPGAAVSAVRRDRSYLVRAARTGIAPDPAPGVAFSMDLGRRPRNLWRRLTRGGPVPAPTPPAAVPIARVPYGGLLVPRALMEMVAPPREDFVLYADDYEYSERLGAAGGLFLAGAAEVEDLEASWNATGKRTPTLPQSQLVRLATMPADFRLYYSLRNALVLDRNRARGMAILPFVLNLTVLVMAGCTHAFARGRSANAQVILQAVRDGVSGRLGRSPDFPLP